MNIKGFVWYREIVDKIYSKHNVVTDEVEEVFQRRPRFLFVEEGNQKDEDVYMAFGRSDAGRYLTILFIYKKTYKAMILSARDMAKRKANRNRLIRKIPSKELINSWLKEKIENQHFEVAEN